jgi:deoxyribodipyrimidine photolyase
MESVMKKSQVDGGELSLTWIQFELLWRDFFRMLTRRLTENALPKVYASGTACI